MSARARIAAASILLAAFIAACATNPAPLPAGQEQWVVDTEKSIDVAVESVRAFVFLERQFKDPIAAALGPGVNAVANRLRRQWPRAERKVSTLLETYKANRTDENRFSVTSALALLKVMATEAEDYMAKYELSKGGE